MNARMPWLLAVLGILMLSTALPAAAKTINLPAFSRNAVSSACTRAGGNAYGIHEEGLPYGCATQKGRVECSPDAECAAYVSDLLPQAATSLDAILGGGLRAGPIKIGATERRITPAVQP